MKYYIDGFKNFSEFKGRSTRKAFLIFNLVNWFIILILTTISLFLLENNFLGLNLLFATLLITYVTLIFIPSISILIRRLHDAGFSGWLVLLQFIPYIGAAILLVFALLPTNNNNNKYTITNIAKNKKKRNIITICIVSIMIVCINSFSLWFSYGMSDWYSTDIEVKEVENEFGNNKYGVYLVQKDGFIKTPQYQINQLTYLGDITDYNYTDEIIETENEFIYYYTLENKNNYRINYSEAQNKVFINDDLNTCSEEINYQKNLTETIKQSKCFDNAQIMHMQKYLETYEQNIKKLSPENIKLIR